MPPFESVDRDVHVVRAIVHGLLDQVSQNRLLVRCRGDWLLPYPANAIISAANVFNTPGIKQTIFR